MIKFFRKIRQKILAENLPAGRAVTFWKYLTYAIGEIILVVIGILIAVQINNWDQLNQRETKEKKMLNELLLNLHQDSFDHEENIKWYDEVSNSAVIINTTLETKSPWNDSLSVHYGNMYTHGISTLNLSAYENLKSTGFDLITNDSIRIELTRLHTIYYELVRKNEEEFSKDNHNQMVLPILTSRLKMERWFHAVPYDYDALMEDLIFQETVRFRGVTMGYVAANIRAANKRVSILIDMIESELKNK